MADAGGFSLVPWWFRGECSVTVRLLVSVRSPDEAISAAAGGADIIDVKEPHHGSLGRPSAHTAVGIRHGLTEHCGLPVPPPLSCALGELREWNLDEPSAAEFPETALAGYHFAKAGLAGCRDLRDWPQRLQRLRVRFAGVTNWVAAAYADAARAEAPEVEQVAAEATAGACRVLLIDTWKKDGSTLLDWLSPARLQRVSEDCAEAGVLLALAGRVQLSHIEILLRARPAIIAVRGAVCEAGDRVGQVRAARVSEFRAALQAGQHGD